MFVFVVDVGSCVGVFAVVVCCCWSCCWVCCRVRSMTLLFLFVVEIGVGMLMVLFVIFVVVGIVVVCCSLMLSSVVGVGGGVVLMSSLCVPVAFVVDVVVCVRFCSCS